MILMGHLAAARVPGFPQASGLRAGRLFFRAASRRRSGFSLIELLLVIAIIALLAALLLPAISKAGMRGKRAGCMNNLKQIGIAFHTFAHDHGDKFPMQVSTNAGGSMEFVSAAQRLGANFFLGYRHLQVLSNELLDPKLVICPADRRAPAQSFSLLQNENVSYFVAATAEFGQSDSIVAGDRNITGASLSGGPVLQIGSNNIPAWTSELHEGHGHILFGDARVELFNNSGLQMAMDGSKATVYLPSLPDQGDFSTQTAPAQSSSRSDAPANWSSASGSSGSSSSGVGGGSAGALSRLEQIFQSTPDKSKGGAAQQPNSGGGVGRISPAADGRWVVADSAPAAERVADGKKTNQPAPSMSGGRAVDPEMKPGDPWAIGLGQLVAKYGSRTTWLLLVLLLAALITMEVIRRRRARQKQMEK